MWYDEFDMDLYEVIPEAREILEPVCDVILYTHGGVMDGRLNHPSVWNHYSGMLAYFGFRDPATPVLCWTDAPVVQCTFEEAVRDCWLHHFTIMVQGRWLIWNSGAPDMMKAFHAILYHTRGIRPVKDLELKRHQSIVEAWLKVGVKFFQKAIEEYEPCVMRFSARDAEATRS